MCFLAYAVSYVGKYTYSTNISNVISDLEISKAYAGYVTSAFFFCYGIGQLVNGILCERMNSKWTISVSLCISATITLSMFFLKSIPVMTVLWGINGLVLSGLWSHCIKVLATIQDERFLKKSVTCISMTLPIGTVVVYFFSTIFTYFEAWKLVYLFAAVLLFAIGVAFFCVVGNVEDGTPRQEEVKAELSNKEEPQGKSLFQVFGGMTVCLFLVAVIAGFVRDGATSWFPELLKDVYHMPTSFSIFFTIGLPLVGVFSAIIDKYLISKTKSIFANSLIVGVTIFIVMFILLFAFESSVVLLIGLFMISTLASYILANLLTSLLPLYYKGQLKSGQTAGLINAVTYMGSTLSTLFLGGIVDGYGWIAFMVVFFACGGLIVVMSLIGLFNKKTKIK